MPKARKPPSPEKIAMAKKLKEDVDTYMKHFKRTYSSIAEGIGWSQPLLSYYLRGKQGINQINLQKICSECNLDPADYDKDVTRRPVARVDRNKLNLAISVALEALPQDRRVKLLLEVLLPENYEQSLEQRLEVLSAQCWRIVS